MRTTVLRDTFTTNETVGKMSVDEAPDFHAETIEQPRNHDIPDHSCIPVGDYDLVPHVSGHLHEDDGVTPLHTYAAVNPALGVFHALADVPTDYAGPNPVRVECLVHPDNIAATLLGCIGPGLTRVQLPTGRWEVTSSRIAFKAWRDLMGIGVSGHTLSIAEVQ